MKKILLLSILVLLSNSMSVGRNMESPEDLDPVIDVQISKKTANYHNTYSTFWYEEFLPLRTLFISSNFNRTGTITVSILETRQTFIRNSGPVSYFSICFSENCELSRPQLTLYIATDVDEERKIFFEISPEQGPDSCSSVYWETISLAICVTLSVLTLFVIMILLSWFNKSVLFSHYKP